MTEFVIYGSVFAFYIPLLIMVITYVLTVRILYHNKNMMKHIERSVFRPKVERSSMEYSGSGVDRLRVLPLGVTGSRKVSFQDDNSGTDATNATILSPTPRPEHLIVKPSTPPCSPTGSRGKADANNEEEHASVPVTQALIIQKAASLSCLQTFPSADQGYSSANSSTTFTAGSKTDTQNKKSNNYASFLKASTSLHLQRQALESDNCRTVLHTAASFSHVSDRESNTANTLQPRCGTPISHGGLNRDYRSVEWNQHFHLIEQEMDKFLQDAAEERKHSQSSSEADENEELLKDQAKDELQLPIQSLRSEPVSDSGDSLDDLDTDSSNASELLTINLHPKSLYMYRLDNRRKKDIQSEDSDTAVASDTIVKLRETEFQNGLAHTCDVSDSDSNVNRLRVNRNQNHRSSLKRFLKKIKKDKNLSKLITSKSTSNEQKASKVLGIIFSVFVVLWTPFFTVNILSVTCAACMSHVTPELMSVFLWMGYVASLANPIIYTMFNTSFRRAFIDILLCQMCRTGRFRKQGIITFAISLASDRRNTAMSRDDLRSRSISRNFSISGSRLSGDSHH